MLYPCIFKLCHVGRYCATAGLEDMSTHSLLSSKHWAWERISWIMRRLGWEVKSHTDYILGTEIRLLRNISVRDPQHNSDHFIVLGCLRGAAHWEHTIYPGRHQRFSLRPLQQ